MFLFSAYADLTYGNDAPRFYGLPRWTVILYVNVNAFVTKSYSCSHRVFPVCLWCRALQLFVSFASLHLSPTLAGGVRLFRCISLLVSLHLAPFLAGGIRLFGRISSFVSLHLFPTLSSGVWLSGCLFRALTCLSSCVFRHVSPNLPVSRSLAINFSPVIVCLSGGVRLFRLFAFVCHPSFVSHFLSRTSSVSEVTCLQSYVCLSRGVLF